MPMQKNKQLFSSHDIAEELEHKYGLKVRRKTIGIHLTKLKSTLLVISPLTYDAISKSHGIGVRVCDESVKERIVSDYINRYGKQNQNTSTFTEKQEEIHLPEQLEQNRPIEYNPDDGFNLESYIQQYG